MDYDRLVSEKTQAEMLDILAIADLKAVQVRGCPVRKFSEIRDNHIPADDDLSTFSDRMLEMAVRDYAAGVEVPKINGLDPDACIDYFEELCDSGRMEIMRDSLLIEREYEILAGLSDRPV